MTIFELGALGELLGAIGVIGTLVYLAVQIRQNSMSLKAGIEQAVADSISNMFDAAAGTDVPGIYVRAASDPDSLTDDELAKLGFYLSSFLKKIEQAYFQYKKGNLSEESWDAIDSLLLIQFQSEGLKRFWHLRAQGYRSDFRDYVESRNLLESPGLGSPEVLEQMRNPKMVKG
jgi:hypothetical protein